MPEPTTTKSVSCDAEGDSWPSPLADSAALCCVAVAQEGLKKLFFLSQRLRPAVFDKRGRHGTNVALRCMPYGCRCVRTTELWAKCMHMPHCKPE